MMGAHMYIRMSIIRRLTLFNLLTIFLPNLAGFARAQGAPKAFATGKKVKAVAVVV